MEPEVPTEEVKPEVESPAEAPAAEEAPKPDESIQQYVDRMAEPKEPAKRIDLNSAK